MNRRFSLFMCLILMFGAVSAAAAQIATEGERLILFLESNAEVITLNGSGIESRVKLPAGAIPAGMTVSEVIISRDGQYAAFWSRAADFSGISPVRTADLVNGTCCLEYTAPGGTPDAYDLGGFEPNGTRFALSYVVTLPTTEGFPYLGGLTVLDAAAGGVTHHLPFENMGESVFPGMSAVWAIVGAWSANGVRIHPNCYACEPPFEGHFTFWNPRSNTFAYEAGELFSSFADELAATGEMTAMGFVTGYPFSSEPAAYFPRWNVILYAPNYAALTHFDNRLSSTETPPRADVIFHDPANPDLSDDPLLWVADGQSILIGSADSWTVLSRFGGSQVIPKPNGAVILAGTTAGWVAAEPVTSTDYQLVAYAVTPDSYTAAELGAVTGLPRVIESPALGESVIGIPAAFTPPTSDAQPAPTVITFTGVNCDGFTPSRLAAGQQAQVTPGESNMFRSAPGRTAEIIGTIPPGAVIEVLDAALCVDNIAWLPVSYNGQLGYTAEGASGVYYIDPVG